MPNAGTQGIRSANCSPARPVSYVQKTMSESASVRPEKTALTCLIARVFSAGRNKMISRPTTQLSRIAVRYGKLANSMCIGQSLDKIV
jgi:hypothetical protein